MLMAKRNTYSDLKATYDVNGPSCRKRDGATFHIDLLSANISYVDAQICSRGKSISASSAKICWCHKWGTSATQADGIAVTLRQQDAVFQRYVSLTLPVLRGDFLNRGFDPHLPFANRKRLSSQLPPR
jgi:hypothetical protein